MDTVNKKTEIVQLISEINKILMRGMRRCFENVGLTMPQSFVLHTLAKYGEMKISDLSKKLNLSNSTISGIVDRLEKQGLVERVRSGEDRRIVFVKATPKFEKIHRDVHDWAEQSFADLLSAGTPEEIEKIIEGLTTLKKILSER